MSTALTIIIAFVGSGTCTTIVQYVINKKSCKSDSEKLMHDTLAAVSYGVLSNEVERLLTKGFATPDERKALQILYEVYKRNGWNGDMDSRMAKVYASPTDRVHEDRRRGDKDAV